AHGRLEHPSHAGRVGSGCQGGLRRLRIRGTGLVGLRTAVDGAPGRRELRGRTLSSPPRPFSRAVGTPKVRRLSWTWTVAPPGNRGGWSRLVSPGPQGPWCE